MDVEKTIEFLLEQQAAHDARQAKFENDLLQINNVMLGVATAQEQGNEIVAVLAQKLVDLTSLVHEHIANLG